MRGFLKFLAAITAPTIVVWALMASSQTQAQTVLDHDGLSVRPTAYFDEACRGKRLNTTCWNKFAFRSDLDTADGDALMIADNTTNSMAFLATASTFAIAYDGTAGGSTRHLAISAESVGRQRVITSCDLQRLGL